MGNVKKNILSASLLLASMVVSSAPADTYRNPILTGMNPDPTICRVQKRGMEHLP